jgi:D-alanyl-D-alanine carboxypeptidase
MRFHRGRRALAGVALVLVATLTACSAPTPVDIDVPAQVDRPLPDDTVAQLQASVERTMAAVGASGAIVGVWAPWSGTWVTGLGTQTPGGDPVEADMVFRGADVTRAMTCDVFFQAVDEGALEADDTVSEWVSGFPNLDDVTLHQLCDSTSGAASYEPYVRRQWRANPDRAWDARELAGYGFGQDRSADPGTAYRDSDAGYLLLGLAVERATGQSLAALFEERIAEPLLLSHTALPGARAAEPAAAVTTEDDAVTSLRGHWSRRDGTQWNCTEPEDFTELSASVGGASAGVVTDIADLGRYAQALATGALVSADADRFASPFPVSADQPTWFTTAGGAYQAGSLVGQYGSVPGYMTAAFADPATGLTVAVVLNNSAADDRIAAWLAWELAALASRAPAAEGESIPEAGLPWTAQQFADQITANAICAAPAE